MMYQGRYIAIRHDGKALILEGDYGEVYQYAERSRDYSPFLKERYPDAPDPMHTRYILKTLHVQGYSGRFRIFVPDTWSEDTCSAFARNEEIVMRLGPALMDPHQTDRSRQMERHYHGAPPPYFGDQG